MIYAAALLCDLGTRPIHTAPVTAPLLALPTENRAIRAKWQFHQPPREFFLFFKKIKKKKECNPFRGKNSENYTICRAGAAGLGTPLTRELNCTHRRPQHLSFVGMQPPPSPVTSATVCRENIADDEASQMDTDGSDQAAFACGESTGVTCCC